MNAWQGTGLLASALVQCEQLGTAATGYAIAPRYMQLVRRKGRDLVSVQGEPPVERLCHLTDAYQVVLFDENGVFRWTWDQRDRCGRWSWLDDTVAANQGWRRLSAAGTVPRLVTGAVVESAAVPGWSMSWDGFSAKVWVPQPAEPKERIAMKVVEYVSTDDHGNVAVVAERPCGWGIA